MVESVQGIRLWKFRRFEMLFFNIAMRRRLKAKFMNRRQNLFFFFLLALFSLPPVISHAADHLHDAIDELRQAVGAEESSENDVLRVYYRQALAHAEMASKIRTNVHIEEAIAQLKLSVQDVETNKAKDAEKHAKEALAQLVQADKQLIR